AVPHAHPAGDARFGAREVVVAALVERRVGFDRMQVVVLGVTPHPHARHGRPWSMDATQPYETILTERIGLVERITLNRPEKRNALSTLLQDELIDAVHAAERGNEVRVIVIRGAGPAFCAGYDINPSREDAARLRPQTLEQDVALTISYGNRWANLWNCRIPVI